jgi:hypothetical protein
MREHPAFFMVRSSHHDYIRIIDYPYPRHSSKILCSNGFFCFHSRTPVASLNVAPAFCYFIDDSAPPSFCFNKYSVVGGGEDGSGQSQVYEDD